jgi:hypothetical protein
MKVFDRTYYAMTEEKGRSVSCSIEGFSDLIALQMTSQDLPNVQMEFSLAADTYLLDFGEKLSPITLSGTFPRSTQCSESTIKNRLNELYSKHRLGKKSVVVTVGDTAYTCYVTGKSCSVSSENPELINYSVSFLGYLGGGKAGKDKKKNEEANQTDDKKPSSYPLSKDDPGFNIGGPLSDYKGLTSTQEGINSGLVSGGTFYSEEAFNEYNKYGTLNKKDRARYQDEYARGNPSPIGSEASITIY